MSWMRALKRTVAAAHILLGLSLLAVSGSLPSGPATQPGTAQFSEGTAVLCLLTAAALWLHSLARFEAPPFVERIRLPLTVGTGVLLYAGLSAAFGPGITSPLLIAGAGWYAGLRSPRLGAAVVLALTAVNWLITLG